MRAFNLYLYLNLNSVLVLLPFLPRHTQGAHHNLLSATLLGKKNSIFLNSLQTSKGAVIRLGLGLYGGLISSYTTTTRRLVTGLKSSGAKSLQKQSRPGSRQNQKRVGIQWDHYQGNSKNIPNRTVHKYDLCLTRKP